MNQDILQRIETLQLQSIEMECSWLIPECIKWCCLSRTALSATLIAPHTPRLVYSATKPHASCHVAPPPSPTCGSWFPTQPNPDSEPRPTLGWPGSVARTRLEQSARLLATRINSHSLDPSFSPVCNKTITFLFDILSCLVCS